MSRENAETDNNRYKEKGLWKTKTTEKPQRPEGDGFCGLFIFGSFPGYRLFNL